MSHRPRLAGDGRLLVPGEVAYDHERGVFRARHGGRDDDPFEWTADRLLMTEAFARLDLSDGHAAARWFGRNGVLDSTRIHRLTVGRPPVPVSPREGWDVIDALALVAAEQATVRWQLTMLWHLSEHRDDRVWDPHWGRVVLEGAAEGLILGTPYAGAVVPPVPYPDEDRYEDEAALRRAVAAWPRVLLGDYMAEDVRLLATDERESRASLEARRRSHTLGTTWDDAVELVRLIIEPRLQVAVERRFATERVAQQSGGVARHVLVPREARVWPSILQPIYLQLFEALRRITEGEPGAALCRECDQPFLVLDARRRFFCNDRERTRHSQRDRRRRLSALDPGAATGQQIMRGPDER